ncbi:hypothetical protein Tco_1476869, partial [Tanacetum coccineum]
CKRRCEASPPVKGVLVSGGFELLRFIEVVNKKVVKQRTGNKNGMRNKGKINNQEPVGNAQQMENNKKHDKPVYQVKKINVSNTGSMYDDNGKGNDEGLKCSQNKEEVNPKLKSGEKVTKKKRK